MSYKILITFLGTLFLMACSSVNEIPDTSSGYNKPSGPTEQPYDPEVNTRALEVDDTPIHTEPLSGSDPDFDPNDLSARQTSASPAVVALVNDANASSQAGDLETAVTTVERALRIEPRNPYLVYKLASLRLDQGKPGLAEDLAKKSALLAGEDKALKRSCWLLIADARERQGDDFGSAEARNKAASY